MIQTPGRAKIGAGRACVQRHLPAIYPPVQDLIKKIEAAADARLSFPANATPADKLARYKNFLKVETHRLKLVHRAGADGQTVCRARAAILDALLRHFWNTSVKGLTPQAQKEFPPLA